MFLLGMSVIFEINRDIPYQVALSFDEIAMEVLRGSMAFRDRGFERISKLTRGRQAALDYAQAPGCFAAIRQRQGIAARALEVTLLTGLRTGEVIGARWTEIDWSAKPGLFRLSVSKTAKTGPSPIGCDFRPKWQQWDATPPSEQRLTCSQPRPLQRCPPKRRQPKANRDATSSPKTFVAPSNI